MINEIKRYFIENPHILFVLVLGLIVLCFCGCSHPPQKELPTIPQQ